MLKGIFGYKNNSDGMTREITIFGKKFTYHKGFWINYLWVKKLWWIFPTKEIRNEFKKICEKADDLQVANKLKKILPNIQNKLLENLRKKQKLKVLFLINENSKWKAQSLYDLMEKSIKFEPIIALTIADYQQNLTKKEQIEILEQNYSFFKNKNMNVILAYDKNKKKHIKLENFQPDIIFYQQPWLVSSKQSPKVTYKKALLCYIPYHAPNYGDKRLDTSLVFFRYLFRYYVANEEYKNIFYKWSGLENMVASGHTILDQFLLNEKRNNQAKEGYVIYAPHHSVNQESMQNSTFFQNGELILNYAKTHPEIKWAFKPHPTLKWRISLTKIWSKEKVDSYYKEWEKIAKCCYDSTYIELFFDSKALITDCSSFLTEYFCTKKPLIRLISNVSMAKPVPAFKKILETFYEIHNEEEFLQTVDRVVLSGDDYKKDERLKALKESKLLKNFAAQNIIDDLEKSIWG